MNLSAKILITLLILLVSLGLSLENVCPGDEETQTPSYSTDSKWHGWSCRRNTMSFFGDVKEFDSIDFQGIEISNKTTLRIHIADTYSVELNSRVFWPLKSLKHLDLHLNSTMIPSDLFSTLTTLETLSLVTYNEELPSNLFDNLRNLKILKLHVLPKGIRLRPEHKRLKHFDAPIETKHRPLDKILSENMFNKLDNLEKLYIHCDCNHIPPKLLYSNSKLQRLSFHSGVGNFDKDFFINNGELEDLELHTDDYISINRHLLLPLTRLDYLEVKGRVVSLNQNAFEKQSKLTQLHIRGDLEQLPENLFKPLKDLLFLDLGSNGIKKLPTTLIWNNTQLNTLRLPNNKITQIPVNFFQFSENMESLIFDENDLQIVNYDTFKSLKNLKDIHLQHNTNFEMYCDYHFSDKTIFPQLTHIYIYDTAHICLHSWIKQLKIDRPEIYIHYNWYSEWHEHSYMIQSEIDPFDDDTTDINKENKTNNHNPYENYFKKSALADCPTISVKIGNKQFNSDNKENENKNEKTRKRKRNYENDNDNDSDDTFFVKETIKMQFQGPTVFVKHAAYWVSIMIDPCSNFKDISSLPQDMIGHEIVDINNNGKASFQFNQPGTYYLVYKYGKDIPFIPYYQFKIEIEDLSF